MPLCAPETLEPLDQTGCPGNRNRAYTTDTAVPPPDMTRPRLPQIARYLLTLFALSTVSLAQDVKPIFDGRLHLTPGKLAGAEEALFQSKVVPAARQAWKQRGRDGACTPGPTVRAVDVTSGSFTRPNATQRAILYVYCEVGHNMDLDGIAIVENGQVAAHIVFEGASNNAIGALPDINGNGIAEIVIASGGTNQGQTWGVISITEINGKETTDFGLANTYMDNCGVDENNCSMEATRISVKPGSKPAFFSEKFVRKDGPWRKTGALAPLALKEDETEYEILK